MSLPNLPFSSISNASSKEESRAAFEVAMKMPYLYYRPYMPGNTDIEQVRQRERG